MGVVCGVVVVNILRRQSQVVPISLKKPNAKVLKPIKAFFWDHWEEQDDTVAFYDQLKEWGLRLRKKVLVSRRLFSFNRHR